MDNRRNIVEFTPQPGGQRLFLQRVFVDELLFGGAAGPGKSWGLVFDALGTQYIHTPLQMPAYKHPDYRAVLFRRKTTQFSKLLDEGKKMYIPLGADLVLSRRGDPGPSFNFPNGFVSGEFFTGRREGARIFICHMEMEDDKESHDGIEYQYCGFDELTQFTVTQYTYLFSRLRSIIMHLNTRMRSTTNPKGSGLVWVKKRFIKNGSTVFAPGKVYYFAPDPDKAIEENPTGILTDRSNPLSRSRCFIPGKLAENKILETRDPNYRLNIMLMGKKYEKALLQGDWDAFGGEFFDDHDPAMMRVSPFKIPKDWTLYGSLDPGWSSPCSFGLHTVSPNGQKIRLFTYYERKLSPREHAVNIKRRIIEFPFTDGRMPHFIVSGHDAFAKKERYSIHSTEVTWEDIFLQEGLYLSPAKTDRFLGWSAWKQMMRSQMWKYFDIYNSPLIEEMTASEHDERVPEDLKGRGSDPDVSDHALDEERYGCMAAFRSAVIKTVEPVARPSMLKNKYNYPVRVKL